MKNNYYELTDEIRKEVFISYDNYIFDKINNIVNIVKRSNNTNYIVNEVFSIGYCIYYDKSFTLLIRYNNKFYEATFSIKKDINFLEKLKYYTLNAFYGSFITWFNKVNERND